MITKDFNDVVWRTPEVRAKMRYSNAYRYVRAIHCSYAMCEHNGECEKCEHNELRMYTARDEDFIQELREENKRLKKELEKKYGRATSTNRKV